MMLMYDVYHRNYKNGQTNKIAILVERRSNPDRQDGLKWARKMFGQIVGDANSIFILPRREDINVG